MMALLDVLQARTERRQCTAQVSCRELGLLSVEALRQAGKLFAPRRNHRIFVR